MPYNQQSNQQFNPFLSQLFGGGPFGNFGGGGGGFNPYAQQQQARPMNYLQNLIGQQAPSGSRSPAPMARPAARREMSPAMSPMKQPMPTTSSRYNRQSTTAPTSQPMPTAPAQRPSARPSQYTYTDRPQASPGPSGYGYEDRLDAATPVERRPGYGYADRPQATPRPGPGQVSRPQIGLFGNFGGGGGGPFGGGMNSFVSGLSLRK